MKQLFFAVVAVSSFALTACGGDPCKSKCSADPAPTAEALKACQNPDTTVKCYAESKKVADCATAQVVCGSDNKTDGLKTLENIGANCKSQTEAYQACMAK